MMDRRHWQDLARTRLREARLLLRAGATDSPYYLAGCAVECALKACIARSFRRHTWPDRRFVQNIHTHDLQRLLTLTGLWPQLEADFSEDASFRDRWYIVRLWDNDSRYQAWERAQALSMYGAVADARHGVLRWIRRYW